MKRAGKYYLTIMRSFHSLMQRMYKMDLQISYPNDTNVGPSP